MKVLHTSNWQLGKKLLGVDVSEEISRVIGEIRDIAQYELADVVILASPIFYRGIDADTVELFLKAVDGLTSSGDIALVAIDADGGGLDAFAPLVNKYNFSIITGSKSMPIYSKNKEYRTNVISAQKGMLEIKNFADERMVISVFNESEADEKTSCADLLASATSKFKAGAYRVLAGESHVRYNQNGIASTIEDDFFENKADYVALGGANGYALVNGEKNVCYSGGIMQNSLDDNSGDKGVAILDFKAGRAVLNKFVAFKNSKKIVEARCDSMDAARKFADESKNRFIDLIFTEKADIKRLDIENLKKKYRNILRITKVTAEDAASSADSFNVNVAKPPQDIVGAFLKSVGINDNELKDLLVNLTLEE